MQVTHCARAQALLCSVYQPANMSSSSSQLKLNCLVLGDEPRHIFSVRISSAENVSALRELVKEKKSPRFDNVPINSLVLWKVSVPVDENFQASLGRLSFVEEESLFPIERLSNIFSDLPVKRHLHIIIQHPPAEEGEPNGSVCCKPHQFPSASFFPLLPLCLDYPTRLCISHPDLQKDRARKRRRLGSENILPDLRIAWKQPLPMLDDLRDFLQLPLDECQKIPISQYSFDTLLYEDPVDPDNSLTESDISKVFRVHNFYSIGRLSGNFTRVLSIDVPGKEATEETFHHFWDTHIRDVLQAILGPRVVELYRNSSYPLSTLMWRPDFWSLVDNLCLFRGEESAYNTSEDPRDELSSKLAGWPYPPAPYIFGNFFKAIDMKLMYKLGYFARGANVTFVAMTGNQDPRTKPSVHDLCSINLALRKNRIQHLLLMIRMVPLLPALAQLTGDRTYPEYRKLQRHVYCSKNSLILTFRLTRGGSKTMELQGTKVMKVYFDPATCVESVKHLKRIYGLLEEKRVPHTDQLVNSSIKMEPSRKWPYVRTSPLGHDRRPRGRDEILSAVMCILRALIVRFTFPGYSISVLNRTRSAIPHQTQLCIVIYDGKMSLEI